MKAEDVDVQIIANLVVKNGDGHVLLTKYNPEVDKWWLPGGDVEPFTHPDEQAAKVLAATGLRGTTPRFKRVQSFRGRRGWHLTFDYLVDAEGVAAAPARWFDPESLPPTMHGDWERSVIRALTQAPASQPEQSRRE